METGACFPKFSRRLFTRDPSTAKRPGDVCVWGGGVIGKQRAFRHIFVPPKIPTIRLFGVASDPFSSPPSRADRVVSLFFGTKPTFRDDCSYWYPVAVDFLVLWRYVRERVRRRQSARMCRYITCTYIYTKRIIRLSGYEINFKPVFPFFCNYVLSIYIYILGAQLSLQVSHKHGDSDTCSRRLQVCFFKAWTSDNSNPSLYEHIT